MPVLRSKDSSNYFAEAMNLLQHSKEIYQVKENIFLFWADFSFCSM
jgi:hypothetical protein